MGTPAPMKGPPAQPVRNAREDTGVLSPSFSALAARPTSEPYVPFVPRPGPEYLDGKRLSSYAPMRLCRRKLTVRGISYPGRTSRTTTLPGLVHSGFRTVGTVVARCYITGWCFKTAMMECQGPPAERIWP